MICGVLAEDFCQRAGGRKMLPLLSGASGTLSGGGGGGGTAVVSLPLQHTDNCSGISVRDGLPWWSHSSTSYFILTCDSRIISHNNHVELGELALLLLLQYCCGVILLVVGKTLTISERNMMQTHGLDKTQIMRQVNYFV